MLKYILITIIIAISSCDKNDNNNATIPTFTKEKLYKNGLIYTVNSNQEWAQAMLVKNGIITAIGSEAEVLMKVSVNAEIIDLNNKMVLPGIHDVHVHPLEAASNNFLFTLNTTETNSDNYIATITEAVADNPNSDWILGWGFDLYTLLEANKEPLAILDAISTTKPIAIMEQTSHAVWVNSKALELASIDKNTLNPSGGIIMKNNLGLPNGLLIDNAGNLLIDIAVASMPNNQQNDYDGLVNYALPELAKNGITSICDARTYWKRNHHLVWQQAEKDGKLTVRVNLGLWLYPTLEKELQINSITNLFSNNPESLLKVNQIKLYSDGIIINTTAAMTQNYLFSIFNLPDNNGLNYLSQKNIANYIAALEPVGFDFHIHAIGNRGVNEALNAIEETTNGDGRHRITHVEYVLPSDYGRFKSLNVTADAQVAGDFSQPANWHETDDFIGAALNNANIPIKNLQQAEARITLSSDWDVSPLNPFIGIKNAVTRAPQEISLANAIRAYTINGAYVMRQETKVGSLEVGKEADFIVLDQNLFSIPANQIDQTKVLKTYLKGNLIFEL